MGIVLIRVCNKYESLCTDCGLGIMGGDVAVLTYLCKHTINVLFRY